MDTEVVPNAAEESTSLADHEQQFGRDAAPERPAPAVEAVPDPVAPPADESDAERVERERDESGRFKPRHKAQSQRATATDVDLINAYTKRLREAEDALGVTIEKKPGESERVYQLRRRAELAEIRRDVKAKAEAPPVARPAKREPPKDFTDPEPRYEDFADQPDQYAAWMRATTAWDRRKEAAEQAKTHHETRTKAEIEHRNAQRDAWFKSEEAKHFERMKAYHEVNPDAQAIIDAAGDIDLTPAMYAAVMTAENSPELLMRVAQDADLRDDLIDLTEGKPLSRDLVARVQRRLNRGGATVMTGAVPPQPKPIPAVPRPPTPVRTGPMKTTDAPPGDEDNLAAHEKYYGKRRS